MPTGGWLPFLYALIVLCGLTGCTGSATRLYVLTPIPAGSGAPAAPAEASRTIGLYPVRLPAYVDRPEIVTRVEASRLHLAELDHWGEPLGDGFTRILGRDLGLLLPTSRVAAFPQAFTRVPEYTVSVEVAQLDGALQQDCTLIARWAVAGKADTDLRADTFIRSAPAGESYATLVAAVSRLIGELAQEIAAGVRGLP